jgi:hypothetical protein
LLTRSLKIKFRFLNVNLMVRTALPPMCRLDDRYELIKPLEVFMKRYLRVLAAAALLVGAMTVATDAMAAGHGGGGGFGGGHMGGGFGGLRIGAGLAGGHTGGGFGAGHMGASFGRGHFASGGAFESGFARQRFAGHFDHDRGFDRRLRFDPGYSDYGCYSYPYYDPYSCSTPGY